MSRVSREGKREEERSSCGRAAVQGNLGGEVTPDPQEIIVNTPLKILENADKLCCKVPEKVRKEIIPYEERLRNYEVVREKIFMSVNSPSSPPKPITNRIQKARNRFERRKSERSQITAAVSRSLGSDERPYAEVQVGDLKLVGLLDSGASVSILGKGCRELVEKLRAKIDRFYSSVSTASGESHTILGKVKLPINYQEKIREITFYLCPYLTQSVYFGVDFWKSFELAPSIFNSGIAKESSEKSLESSCLVVSEINQEKSVQSFAGDHCKLDSKLSPHVLSESQQRQLDEVKKQFKSFEVHGLGRTPLEMHTIQLIEGAQPVKDRHYPISPAVQEIVYKEVDQMLELGVIEECESPWSNRTTVVRKPGKNRFCLDARKLNERTVKDAYPLQNIDGILSRLDYTFYISSVDLKNAFWQIELEEKSKSYTAFTVPGRPLYQFVVMPFGLCNAAQRLCRLMDKVIPQKLKSHVFIYLDDLLIIAEDFETHLKVLSEVAKCLHNANLTIGLKKSFFCFKELRYLGYIVGGGSLRTDPEKVAAILKISMPKTVKEVRSFLGTAGWYRRFIANFASVSAPLSDLLKSKSKFVVTPESIEAFNTLKVALTTAPVLRHPDFKRRFWVQCDASHIGIGAVLYQINDEGHENPIAFYSQKLNKCQRNYSVTEKECLAAILAVERFRPYIELMTFTVVTDHASLKWLMQLKDLTGRLARWSLRLQPYDFDIQHRKGTENVVADTLSRFVESLEFLNNEIFDFETTEFESEEYLGLLEMVQKNQDRLPDLKVLDGMVFKRTNFVARDPEFQESTWKLYVPASLTNTLIEKAHAPKTCSHGGVAKTLHRLRRWYFWPKMTVQVRNFIKNCDICNQVKSVNVELRPSMGNQVVTHRPFQKLYIDFLGKYPRSKRGKSYIFIVVDHFTKFTFLKSMKEATTANVIEFLVKEVFLKFGTPEIIHSDNGKQFVSKAFEDVMKKYQIKHLKTPIYSPQSNAAERVNQSILSAIRAYLQDDHRDWDLYLPEIESALRTSIHSATGVTPFFALFGYNIFTHGSDYNLARKLNAIDDSELRMVDPKDRLELIREKMKKNMNTAYEKGARQYNKRTRNINFAPNQEVYRRNFVQSSFKDNINAKFCNKWVKARVVKPVGNSSYELEDLKGRSVGIFHAKDIKQ